MRALRQCWQLLLDRGRWRGKQLVSEGWIELATQDQAESDYRDESGQLYPYGYYFWIVPGVGFAGWGHGGQFVLVVPAERMVLVQISLPDTDNLHGANLNDFVEVVAPLLRRDP